jgi:hypothetical protein
MNLNPSQPTNGAVLIGVGIASGSRKCFSAEVPFDLVSFLLAAEAFRARTGIPTGIILIADNPAMYLGIGSTEAVSGAANKAESAVKLVLKRFALDSWKIIHGCSFATEPEYLDLAADYEEPARQLLGAQAPQEAVRYFAGQTADVEFLRRHAGIVVKFGWSGRNAHGERDFDDCYSQVIQAA